MGLGLCGVYSECFIVMILRLCFNAYFILSMLHGVSQSNPAVNPIGPPTDHGCDFLSPGFNDLVHAAAAISAISRGYTQVDGLRTGTKYVEKEYTTEEINQAHVFLFTAE